MNYIKHLTGFFEKVALDRTLNPTHVSLYIALFQFWNCNRFKNPISISRDEVMRISKISSKATYHKCLKNLHALGYIDYQPSYNPFRGSHVILFNFSEDLKPFSKSERKPKNEPHIEPVAKQALNKSCTSSETGTEQAVVPSINYRNNTNILNKKNVSNLGNQAKNFEEINNSSDKIVIPVYTEQSRSTVEGTQKEKSSAKKEIFSTFANILKNQKERSQKDKTKVTEPVEVPYNQKLNPLIEEVKTYFQSQNFPELEAQKFFNYFSSIGWLIGGKIPMLNWQAAAQNWMINAPKFISNPEQPNRAKQLNTTTNKDYAEPL
nr:transcriptional regulator [uncultured Flavobacterium sp.]